MKLFHIFLILFLIIPLSCTDNSNSISSQIELCDNNIDDDLDGYIDCDDQDCSNDTSCLVEICDNNIDDDLDGYIDCDDNGCSNDASCLVEICDNNIDDDLDGDIDCDDNDCSNDASCLMEICDNNIDDDLDGYIDCDDNDCLSFSNCQSKNVELCKNNIDDDLDGYIDCNDQDCYQDPACIQDCDPIYNSGCNILYPFCYIDYSPLGMGTSQCYPSEGSTSEGSPCHSSNECVIGYVCSEVNNQYLCQQLCHSGGSPTPNECPTGFSCSYNSGDNYGICE